MLYSALLTCVSTCDLSSDVTVGTGRQIDVWYCCVLWAGRILSRNYVLVAGATVAQVPFTSSAGRAVE